MTSTDTPPAGPSGPVPSVLLVGVHGHGRHHLRSLLGLQAAGRLRLAGLVDPRPLTAEDAAAEAATAGVDADPAALPHHHDLDAALTAGRPDVVVLCTPIHTHVPLATRALEAGADVLLEKPPTPGLADLEELLEVESRSPGVVQVGFQTFGSTALDEVARLLAAGEIGELTGVGAVGTWVRTTAYWTRSPWTGHRTLEGRPVVDGVVTNPLAHAVATALHLAGATTSDDVRHVELDLYRANAIEADDTSAVRVTTRAGIPVSLGLTLCSDEHRTPVITVRGTAGTAVYDYYADTVEVHADGAAPRTYRAERTPLVVDLLDHRAHGTPLRAPLAATGAFTRVLEAVRTAPDPTPIGPDHVRTVDDGEGPHLVVEDVADWCRRVAEEHATFAELGAPWARREGAR